MLAIRWEGQGPIFYRQERVTTGRAGVPDLKLRTMRVDAEAQGAVWAAEKGQPDHPGRRVSCAAAGSTSCRSC